MRLDKYRIVHLAITMKTFLELLEETQRKGLHVFDIDDTTFHTHAKIHVKDHEGKHVESLTPEQFNTHKLGDGHHYDFHEFRDSHIFHSSTPIHPMVRKIRAIQKNGGHVVFNTARADFDDKDRVLDKFRSHGIDMDKSHLYRAGNESGKVSTAEKKNIVVRRMIDKYKPSHIHFYDDADDNHRAFLKLKTEYPHVSFHSWKVHPTGKVTKFEE